MVLSEDADQENTEEKFRGLCADLNIDRNTADEAWRNYETISTNYTLEVRLMFCSLWFCWLTIAEPSMQYYSVESATFVFLIQLFIIVVIIIAHIVNCGYFTGWSSALVVLRPLRGLQEQFGAYRGSGRHRRGQLCQPNTTQKKM